MYTTLVHTFVYRHIKIKIFIFQFNVEIAYMYTHIMYTYIVDHIKLFKKFYIKQTFFGFFRKFSRSGVDVDVREVLLLLNQHNERMKIFTSLCCMCWLLVCILDRCED